MMKARTLPEDYYQTITVVYFRQGGSSVCLYIAHKRLEWSPTIT